MVVSEVNREKASVYFCNNMCYCLGYIEENIFQRLDVISVETLTWVLSIHIELQHSGEITRSTSITSLKNLHPFSLFDEWEFLYVWLIQFGHVKARPWPKIIISTFLISRVTSTCQDTDLATCIFTLLLKCHLMIQYEEWFS